MKFAFLLLLLLLTPTAARGAEPALQVIWSPLVITDGAAVLFQVRAFEPLRTLTGRWQNRRIAFDFHPPSGTWQALAGVELDTPPGIYQLALEGTTRAEQRVTLTQTVTVERARRGAIALRVPGRYTEPDPATLARIKEEREIKAATFANTSEQRLWRGAFVAPIGNVVTESYGVRRTFNGATRSVHQGTDYRAAEGEFIGAINEGTVVLARQMFYEGGFVVIDHGRGLMSLYMHLSQINVREGDRVAKAQIIGLSGATGRVTGAHLHLGVRWQGVYLDPAALINLPLN